MARRMLTRAFLLLALAGAMFAGSAQGQAPVPHERMVQRVYSVADLVVPIDAVKAEMGTGPSAPATPVHRRIVGPDGLERIGIDFETPQCQPKPVGECCSKSCPSTPATCEGQLIKLLQTTVAPKTWTNGGGAGTIEYNATSMALVVHQTPVIQEQVDELLSSLRRLQDTQVAMDIHVVTISDRMFEHMAQEFELNQQPSKLLDGDTVAKILDAFQGDRRSCVVQAPKLTTFNGQEARVVCGDERFFVTGMKAVRHNDQPVLMPQNERFTTGSNITVQPTVTPDRRNIVVKFHAEVSELPDAAVPLFPVTTFVTPVFEGGAQGQPIPFTQFIQQPTVVTRGVTKVFGIPDGKTGYIYGGRCSHTVKNVTRVPVLGDLPMVGELFKSESESVESNHLIFLVTPKVVLTGDAEERATVVPPCQDRKLHVGLMPTQAPMAVLAAANCCTAPTKKAEPTCANSASCAQCPNATCPAACCNVPPQLLPTAVEVSSPPTPTVESKPTDQALRKLLAKYQRACAEGRTKDAKKLAGKCLAIDPMCFAKEE